jgi:Fe-S-cluster containining protein
VPRVATKWYQTGLCFDCRRCGNCCSGPPGYVWVTRAEIRAIAEYLGRSDGKLDKRELRRVGLRYSLTELADGDCIFLKRERGRTYCLIHEVRPTQCRTWPFWDGNLRSPEAWNMAVVKCPGMNRGKHYDFATIEALRKEL